MYFRNLRKSSQDVFISDPIESKTRQTASLGNYPAVTCFSLPSGASSSRSGGAIFYDGSHTSSSSAGTGSLAIIDSEISDNDAGQWGLGGAIYARAINLTIDGDSKLNNNNAINAAGAIFSICPNYATTGILNIKGNTEISGNTSERGGAIITSETQLIVEGNAKITNNTASTFGGGINMWYSNTTNKAPEIKGNAVISGNRATDGAGVYYLTRFHRTELQHG